MAVRRRLALLMLPIILVTAPACRSGSTRSSGPTHELSGQVNLAQFDAFPPGQAGVYSLLLKPGAATEGSGCQGKLRLDLTGSDLKQGADVVVRDQADSIIGKSSLSGGSVVGGGLLSVCRLAFSVKSIPTVTFYTVTVGEERARIFSRVELDAAHWAVVIRP